MSRDRNEEWLRWWQEDGEEHLERRRRKGPRALTDVPNRVVDIYDPSGHWLATLARLADDPSAPPLLVKAAEHAPGWAWFRDGFDGVVVADGMVGLLGVRRPEVPIYCGRCARAVNLTAERVASAVASLSAGRDRRARRVVVDT